MNKLDNWETDLDSRVLHLVLKQEVDGMHGQRKTTYACGKVEPFSMNPRSDGANQKCPTCVLESLEYKNRQKKVSRVVILAPVTTPFPDGFEEYSTEYSTVEIAEHLPAFPGDVLYYDIKDKGGSFIRLFNPYKVYYE